MIITMCPSCSRPAHASESNDDGVCCECLIDLDAYRARRAQDRVVVDERDVSLDRVREPSILGSLIKATVLAFVALYGVALYGDQVISKLFGEDHV